MRLLHDTADRTRASTGSEPDPIAASVSRADLALPHYLARRGLPDSSDRPWWRCSDVLAAPGALDHWRSALGHWMRDRYGEAPDHAVAGYLMCWYLAVPARLAGQIFHMERRLPSLRPADLAFRLAGHRPRPDGIAVLSSAFACLPDDPAAAHPHATVVADEAALATRLRTEFAAHADRFVAVFGPRTRLGARTLWAAATDALDEALWLAGRYSGDENAGVRDAALVLPAQCPPFTSGSTLRDAPGGPAASRSPRTPAPTPEPAPAHTAPETMSGAASMSGPAWTRRRESCCFHYTLANGCGPCATCPRLSRGHRPSMEASESGPCPPASQ